VNASAWTPALAPHLRLRHDPVRNTDLLLMPERVVALRGNAGTILRLCDGARSVETIVAELTRRYPNAPVAQDVPAFLQKVHTQGWLT
jgi:pyrroloquinoline quinone biosynthesis protein D